MGDVTIHVTLKKTWDQATIEKQNWKKQGSTTSRKYFRSMQGFTTVILYVSGVFKRYNSLQKQSWKIA